MHLCVTRPTPISHLTRQRLPGISWACRNSCTTLLLPLPVCWCLGSCWLVSQYTLYRSQSQPCLCRPQGSNYHLYHVCCILGSGHAGWKLLPRSRLGMGMGLGTCLL